METKECGFSGFKMNGFLALFLHLVVLTAVIIFGFLISVPTLILSVCLCLVWFILFAGYMELEPNEARAMVFFGKYKGTFKETGFFWVNPFLNKKKLSLRARNLDVEPIKVNDKIGNPILIGLVIEVFANADILPAVAMASLVFNAPDLLQSVCERTVYQPNPDTARTYADAYRRFLSLYPMLRTMD